MRASSDLKLRRTFAVLTICTFAVFAGLLFGLTMKLRGRLRHEIQQRETQSIHDVAAMQITQAEARLNRLGVQVSAADVFAAVLESSRLHGVLAVQVFDPAGKLQDALPEVAVDPAAIDVWWPRPLSAPDARYYPHGRLEQILALPPDAESDASRTPLIDVVVPLRRTGGAGSLGVARYWLDGSDLQAEFGRLDRSLAAQAGIAFVGGAVLVALLLGWSYRRLTQVHQQLLERSADLSRANQELDFAAKTGALGAISAHLIHGLKNPLAGLEGFVAETVAADDTAVSGEAGQTALETARRIRALVNDVVSVLRDETSGSAEYRIPVGESLDAVRARASPVALARGVNLLIGPAPAVQLVARTANLAGLVLANLLANAIEASPAGASVQVDVMAVDDRVEFLVTDHGTGLPAAVRDALFRPVVSTKPGGGGMGLAISSRLARHAAGDLSLVRSDPNGTVFRLAVPAAKPM